jgi:hypothetical protein
MIDQPMGPAAVSDTRDFIPNRAAINTTSIPSNEGKRIDLGFELREERKVEKANGSSIKSRPMSLPNKMNPAELKGSDPY